MSAFVLKSSLCLSSEIKVYKWQTLFKSVRRYSRKSLCYFRVYVRISKETYKTCIVKSPFNSVLEGIIDLFGE